MPGSTTLNAFLELLSRICLEQTRNESSKNFLVKFFSYTFLIVVHLASGNDSGGSKCERVSPLYGTSVEILLCP